MPEPSRWSAFSLKEGPFYVVRLQKVFQFLNAKLGVAQDGLQDLWTEDLRTVEW